ncbi:MAG: transketolase [Deltaproteobacteria bacterium]|nr:MAG: transketolase [Deltaproteobacteria bacterium]
MPDKALDHLSINAIRSLAIDAIQQANSGHPGLPLGAAPMAYVLWTRHLRHNPRDPAWPDRDRFVLSAGHGSMLLYALLHLTGYDVSLDDLRQFRQWGSKTPGHPEVHVTPGVETTTGPLGQGAANAVGIAIAERALAHRFNRPGHTVVDHMTYALVSDGDLMEGVAAEAASLAGHLGLGKLVYLYDANGVCLDGPTDETFTEDVGRRFEAYGWQVIHVADGDTDIDAIDRAIQTARDCGDRPSLIVVKTTIGFGSPNKQGTSKAHGAPLGAEEVELTKRALGIDDLTPFAVPAAAVAHFRTAIDRGGAAQADWQRRLDAWEADHPDLAAEWRRRWARELPAGWDAELPSWPAGEAVATRVAAGKAENAIAAALPELLGGDADLSCSTMTAIAGGGSFDGRTGAGRNIHFGVREHAMGAICNGMDYHGGVRPFASTFFVFSDYMRPAVRIAALNRQPVIYVWTHDSIALGEDGPTHQPVEHLMSLRAMPNLHVVRPADANEAAEAWRYAVRRTDGPTALVLTRQKVPTLDRSVYPPAAELVRGAYVLVDADDPQALILATGSEVHVALAAHRQLAAGGVRARVVAMPCWEAFAEQPADYRERVLPKAVRARVAVEAGVTLGWERWIGDVGIAVGLDRFGASAPGPVLLERLGIHAAAVVDAVRAAIDRAG